MQFAMITSCLPVDSSDVKGSAHVADTNLTVPAQSSQTPARPSGATRGSHKNRTKKEPDTGAFANGAPQDLMWH